jgi:hypothetical protein
VGTGFEFRDVTLDRFIGVYTRRCGEFLDSIRAPSSARTEPNGELLRYRLRYPWVDVNYPVAPNGSVISWRR